MERTGVGDDVALDVQVDRLRARVEEIERERESLLHGYGADVVAPRERAVLPDILRWWLRMCETVVLIGKTRLEILDETLERRAARLQLRHWNTMLLTVGTTAFSVLLTVLLNAIFSRLLPASVPVSAVKGHQ